MNTLHSFASSLDSILMQMLRGKRPVYRWNDGSQGGCKAWWISVPTVLENEELTWLASEVYSDSSTDRVEISRINAIDRFSVREKLICVVGSHHS